MNENGKPNENGENTMSNPRMRGKIAHSEWPKIAARVATGESFAAVARSYRCTAPAIRYIVQRMSARQEAVGKEQRSIAKAQFSPSAPERYRKGSPPHVNGASKSEFDPGLWSRVNGDIAAFLSAVDALIANHSEDNERALLSATDDLLRATARTRVEIEKAIRRKRDPKQHTEEQSSGAILHAFSHR